MVGQVHHRLVGQQLGVLPLLPMRQAAERCDEQEARTRA
jgi:hypothetical protein